MLLEQADGQIVLCWLCVRMARLTCGVLVIGWVEGEQGLRWGCAAVGCKRGLLDVGCCW